MKPELDLLIELLEIEKQSLESLIKENLAEHEYLNVHHYGEALMRVNGQLYLFNCFKDPFYEREQRLERMLNHDKIDDSPFLKSFWKKTIADEKEEIKKLRNQTGNYFNDAQEIDDALFDLLGGKFSRFRLCFSHRGESFYLEFRMEDERFLNISTELSNLVNVNDPDDPESNQLHLFRNLGFKLSEENDLLIYRYDMCGTKDVIAIKTMLSRIVYDIGYYGDERTAKLEFFE
jgi:hypothetical protein